MNKKQVRKIIEALEGSANVIAKALDGEARLAARMAGVLLRAVSGLLISRTPEEVVELLTQMAAEPAERAHLDVTRDALQRILEERRRNESSET